MLKTVSTTVQLAARLNLVENVIHFFHNSSMNKIQKNSIYLKVSNVIFWSINTFQLNESYK